MKKYNQDKILFEVDPGRMENLLSQAHSNLETVDKEGFTPLIFAASKGRTDIVKLLIEAGADLEAADSRGNTALGHAALNGHLEVEDLLEQAKIKQETKIEDKVNDE